MNVLNLLVSIPVIGLLASSCVRTGAEDCPTPTPTPPDDASQYTVHIGIKDKNYTNVQSIDPTSVVDENQPLPAYLPNFSYELAGETGKVVRSVQSVTTAKTIMHDLVLDELTPGRYVLTVWGNAASLGQLHNGTDEGTDLYLGRTTIDVNGGAQSSELLLERTKGLVKVVFQNLPPSVTRIRMQFGPVYQQVDGNFGYSGETMVIKTVPAASTVTMYVAPSLAMKNSSLTVQFFTATDTDTPSLTLSPILQNVQRNGLSLIEVDYNTNDDLFEIWTTVNGQWTHIHDETLRQDL